MTEQKNQQNMKKEDKKSEPRAVETKPAVVAETPKTDVKTETTSEKKVEKPVVKLVKKEEAVAKGNNLHVSMKQCMFICRFIKNKSIDQAISELEEVIKLRRAIPFVGEIPHRKGKIMSGRYPITACKLMIPILKSLKGNVLTNQMDLDKSRIYFASSSYASRPSKKGGGTFKRANIVIKAKEMIQVDNKSNIDFKSQPKMMNKVTTTKTGVKK